MSDGKTIPAGHVIVPAKTILDIRDALVAGNIEDAYHHLYRAVDPDFCKFHPWREVEAEAEESIQK